MCLVALTLYFEAMGFRHPESLFSNLILGPWTQYISWVILLTNVTINQYKQWYQQNYTCVSNLWYYSNIDVLWISQHVRMICIPKLTTWTIPNHVVTRATSRIWYIDPNGIETTTISNTHILIIPNHHYEYPNDI